ncbi:di-heme cytochrome domain-containing protein [Janthinobacterium sp. HH01]|uniref:cytochrome b/b6 domain-containing protein n=1 Tax=Janthinobacterium sp. HH01 TaxID=1198452 RepID=UPI0002AEAEC0|nr:cytochrome b/b6 domain-containing protein [Janthinobacterium sp. HH01]ELX12814.1 di-heme cytochrome domain-containing protein [Janthinobacterium sp. HH01]
MTTASTETVADGGPPLWMRLCHWTNAVAFLVMLTSGWQVFNASPFWIDHVPTAVTLGGSLPGALLWHFAGMWVLAANGIVALTLLVASGRLRRLYLSLGRGHQPGGERSRLQKVAYLGVLMLLALEILSGLAIWKPVQLQVLTQLAGGFQRAREVHFICMTLLGMFVAGHVVLALSSPRLLLAMLGLNRRTR